MGVTWPEPIGEHHPTDNDQQVDDRDEDPPGAARGEPVDQHPERTEQDNDEPQSQEVPRQGRSRSPRPAAGTAGTPVVMWRRARDRLITAWVNGHTGTVEEHDEGKRFSPASERD